MTPRQIHLVQTTWSQVAPAAPQVAALFYGRLFELDPGLRPLFPPDLREQGAKLMTMLTMVVKGLDRPETLLPVARQLGRRHVDYGVQDSHYATVGAALLWTLGEGLGDAFDAEAREAWSSAYTFLADAMRSG